MAIVVVIFCGLLFLFMRGVGSQFGRSIGTLAGLAVVLIPIGIIAAIALIVLALTTGGIALLVAVPVLLFLGYRRLKAL